MRPAAVRSVLARPADFDGGGQTEVPLDASGRRGDGNHVLQADRHI
jgi:hypothetical protein